MKFKVFGCCIEHLSCDIEAETEELALKKFDREWQCGNLQSAGGECYTTAICDDAGNESVLYQIVVNPVEQIGGLC